MLKAYSLHPHITKITENFVRKAHKRRFKVFVWTVNKPTDIQEMKKLGVDGIFSDYPDRI